MHDELELLQNELQQVRGTLPSQIDVTSEGVEQGLAQLVLTLVEFLRQLLERQAVRRMEGGSLSEEEVERVGLARVLQSHPPHPAHPDRRRGEPRSCPPLNEPQAAPVSSMCLTAFSTRASSSMHGFAFPWSG